MKRLASFIISALVILSNASMAWPPACHDAIAEKTAISITHNETLIENFRSGSILVDIVYILQYTGIGDAVKVMHNEKFAKEMLSIAKEENNRKKMAWSEGWLIHCVADEIWATRYYKACNVPEKFNFRQACFYIMNEKILKERGHMLLSFHQWKWYPELVIKAYNRLGGRYRISPVMIDYACSLYRIAVFIEYFTVNAISPLCIFHEDCVYKNWEKYYNISINAAIENISSLNF